MASSLVGLALSGFVAVGPAHARLAAAPIALYHYSPPNTRGSGAYSFRVIVRLDKPLASRNRHLLGYITLDGGGGYEGLVHAVPVAQRQPHAYCYEQLLDSDAQPHDIPRLDHPHAGDAATMVLHLTDPGSQSQIQRVVHLAPDRHPGSDSTFYERRLGCVRARTQTPHLAG